MLSIFCVYVGHLYIFFGEMSVQILCLCFDWVPTSLLKERKEWVSDGDPGMSRWVRLSPCPQGAHSPELETHTHNWGFTWVWWALEQQWVWEAGSGKEGFLRNWLLQGDEGEWEWGKAVELEELALGAEGMGVGGEQLGNKEQGDSEAGGARYLEGCIESKEKPGEVPAWLMV